MNETTHNVAPIETAEVQTTPVAPVVTVPRKKTLPPCDQVIKGNITESGEKIFISREVSCKISLLQKKRFCTRAEAMAAGYRKSKR